MGKIIILDESTANKIAAGEVVERPASVVKELAENSIDAGSASVVVEIKSGGITYIRISDNGTGIDEDDIEIAFERHSTSKIKSSKDLEKVSTMGFRGEALASIASVANVELVSRTERSNQGTRISLSGGKVIEKTSAGCPVGTTVTVRDLFFNTPARYKFLKKDTAEAGFVSEIIERIALGNPDVSFKLISSNKPVLHTPGSGNILSAISSIYGREIIKSLIEVKYSDNKCSLHGYIGKPDTVRSSRNYQSFYMNKRYIKSKLISFALEEAYKTLVPFGKHPFAVLNIDINPMLVDINVHPTKMEVRFSEEQHISNIVYNAINSSLLSKNLFPGVELNRESYIPENNSIPLVHEVKEKFVQENMYEKPGYFENEKKNVIDYAKAGNNLYIKEDNISQINKESEIRKEDIPDECFKYRIIGQAFSTYIFLEVGDEVYIVDQHAAHERIVYESLIKRLGKGDNIAQMLIAPYILELSSAEVNYAGSNCEIIEQLGFEFEPFGTNSIAIRAIPSELDASNPGAVFLDLLDTMMESGIKDLYQLKEYAVYTMACKHAVKANMKLSEAEMERLIGDLTGLRNPFTCPHGRPTIIRITKNEFEKKFKRT